MLLFLFKRRNRNLGKVSYLPTLTKFKKPRSGFRFKYECFQSPFVCFDSFPTGFFMLFMGLSSQECWSGLPFPSPVDHILSELSTMSRPSWVALHGMASQFHWVRQGCDPHGSVWISKFLKRWEYQTTLPASWETCMQVKMHQLELDTEQWTGPKLEKSTSRLYVVTLLN